MNTTKKNTEFLVEARGKDSPKTISSQLLYCKFSAGRTAQRELLDISNCYTRTAVTQDTFARFLKSPMSKISVY